MQLAQIIEWHRARVSVARLGEETALTFGDVESALLFRNAQDFHAEAVALLETLK